jgi:hypothetical protein
MIIESVSILKTMSNGIYLENGMALSRANA